jgi:PilZ domain
MVIWHQECIFAIVPFNLFRFSSRDKNRKSDGDPMQKAKTTKRQWVRYPVEMPVELRTRPEEVNTIYGRALDLCEQGLGMLAACDLAVGQRIEIDFTIPQVGQHFKFPAEVRNRNGYRYGLQFSSMPGQQPTFAEMLSILG